MPSASSARGQRPVLALLLAAGLGFLPVVLAFARGGYFASTWLGVGSALAVASLVLVYGRAFDYPGLSRRLPGASTVALALFALFFLWNLVSLAWATDRAAALSESTRVLLLMLLFVLALAVLRTPKARDMVLATLVLGTAATSVAVVLKLAVDPGWALLFSSIKMTYPLGYANANGAFFALMVYPGLYLASRRLGSVWIRSLFFAATLVLLQMTLLSQSRAAFWALIAAGLLYLAITPYRIRAMLWGGALLGFFVVTFPALNVLRLDLTDRDSAAFLDHAPAAAKTIAVSFLVALALGALLAFVDRRLAVRGRVLLASRAAAAIVFALLVLLAFARIPALSDPVGTIDRAWGAFSGQGQEQTDWSRSAYFLNMDGNGRYPLWQVAWQVYQEHPALGVGADNYLVEWQYLRPSAFAVRQPHNLYLRLLAELGIPGLLLFLAPVAVVVGAGAVRLWRRPWETGRPAERAAFAALLAACTYFLVHDSVEWLWNFPALAGAFFVLLGAMAVVGDSPVEAEAEAESEDVDVPDAAADDLSPRRGSLPLVVGVTAGAVLLLCLPQFLAERSVGHSRALLAQGDPVSARRSAGWAARLNPLESAPYLLEGRAWAAEGETRLSEEAFRTAIEKDPSDWQVYLAWARATEARGEDPKPLLDKARALNPLEPSLNPKNEASEG